MNEHSDRDKTEPPARDDRVHRYADAIMGCYSADGQKHLAHYLDDEARAVMAVADAEQAELRAEVERLREERDGAQRETQRNIQLLKRAYEREAAYLARAEAAERALADERAKVARVEAEVERHRAFGKLPLREQFDRLPSVGMVVEAFAAALDGDA